jgi:hypothetical protein
MRFSLLNNTKKELPFSVTRFGHTPVEIPKSKPYIKINSLFCQELECHWAKNVTAQAVIELMNFLK